MTTRRGVWLIGFRGAGKTTLGRSLAEQTDRDFLDLDEEWEKRSGRSILSFVNEHGIEAFRKEEEKLLAEASFAMDQRPMGLVVATGGGCVEWAPSREILLRSSHARIFLSLPPEALWERLKGEPDRRKIGGLTDPSALAELLEKRRPFYEKIATFHLMNRDIYESLAALKSHLEER